MILEQIVIGIVIFLGIFLLIKKIFYRRQDLEIIKYDRREDIHDINCELDKIRKRHLNAMKREIDILTRRMETLSKKVDSNYVNVRQMRSRMSSLEDHIN